ALARHHGEHEKELCACLSRQAHVDVVGRHPTNAAAPEPADASLLPWELPQIFAVVEHFRNVHVIGLIHLRLDEEEILRIADVLLEIRWHGIERLEQLWEYTAVGREDWVRGVRHVEIHAAVIGIDDDLDRVADVVRPPVRKSLRVGEPAAPGVGVPYPEETPRADHQIGVTVEAQKRGYRFHPVRNVAAEQDARAVGEIAAEQYVRVVEIPGEK